MKLLKKKRLVVGYALLIIGAIGIIGMLTTSTDLPYFTSILILYIFIGALGAAMLLYKSKREEAQEKEIQELQNAEKEQSRNTIYGDNIYGLPFAKTVKCEMLFDDSSVIFFGGVRSFELDYEQIINIRVVNYSNMLAVNSASAGSFTEGYGNIGEIIANLNKSKRRRPNNTDNFLILTYGNNKGKSQYIYLKIYNFLKTEKLIEKYLKKHPQ